MRHQIGATLISLLIGLLISMLCLIGLLSSYRTIAKTGAESRMAATHDTDLQNGLTAAQMLVQNAGFGLDGSSNLSIETIAVGSNNTSALLWRYKDGSTTTCQGLADIPNASKRKFIIIEVQTGCDSTSNLNTFTWTEKSILANLANYSTGSTNPQQVTFQRASSTCTPFGAVIADNSISHPLVTISAKTSTQNIAGLNAIEVPVCILNISS